MLKREGRAAGGGGKPGRRDEAKCFDSVSQTKVASYTEIYLCGWLVWRGGSGGATGYNPQRHLFHSNSGDNV